MRSIYLLLLALISSAAHASSLIYTPESVEIDLAPGEQTAFALRLEIAQPTAFAYFVGFIQRVEGDAVAHDWLSVEDPDSFIFGSEGHADTAIQVQIPDGALPGTYLLHLWSRARPVHGEDIDPGPGVAIRIQVGACTQPPAIEARAIPELLWPPNGRVVPTSISGQVVLKSGCQLDGLHYRLEDSYGLLSSKGEVATDAQGRFNLELNLEARRRGRDRAGRHYRVILEARTPQGSSETRLTIPVPHDQGRK